MNALPINKIFLAGFAFALTHWKKIIEISILPLIIALPLFSIIPDLLILIEETPLPQYSMFVSDPDGYAEIVNQFVAQLPENTSLYLLLCLYAQITLSINMYRLVIQGESLVNGLIPILDIRKIIKFFALALLVLLVTNIFSGSFVQMILSFLIVPITLNFVRISIGEAFQFKWNLSFIVQVNLFFIQMVLPLILLLLLVFIDGHLGADGIVATTLFVIVYFYWVPITLALCYQLINNSAQNP